MRNFKRSFKDKVYFSKEEIWSYRFCRKKNMVYIRTPQGDRTYPVGITSLPGWDIHTLERALNKRWIKIRPREIKSYIKEHFKTT